MTTSSTEAPVIDPQKLPEVDDWEFKDLTKGRKEQAIANYRHRTGLSEEEARAVMDYWQSL